MGPALRAADAAAPGTLPSGNELLNIPRPTPDAMRRSARKYT